MSQKQSMKLSLVLTFSASPKYKVNKSHLAYDYEAFNQLLDAIDELLEETKTEARLIK
ncbi:MAG: hypothetical protein KME30_32220 [Iphinoe sp. HA4291-MV1]|jgi:hypothetical protein|nr:hypothetical protein [Iphinoe sp. HA4291-MV1]